MIQKFLLSAGDCVKPMPFQHCNKCSTVKGKSHENYLNKCIVFKIFLKMCAIAEKENTNLITVKAKMFIGD